MNAEKELLHGAGDAYEQDLLSDTTYRAQHSCWCSCGRYCTKFAVGNYCTLRTRRYKHLLSLEMLHSPTNPSY